MFTTIFIIIIIRMTMRAHNIYACIYVCIYIYRERERQRCVNILRGVHNVCDISCIKLASRLHTGIHIMYLLGTRKHVYVYVRKWL